MADQEQAAPPESLGCQSPGAGVNFGSTRGCEWWSVIGWPTRAVISPTQPNTQLSSGLFAHTRPLPPNPLADSPLSPVSPSLHRSPARSAAPIEAAHGLCADARAVPVRGAKSPPAIPLDGGQEGRCCATASRACSATDSRLGRTVNIAPKVGKGLNGDSNMSRALSNYVLTKGNPLHHRHYASKCNPPQEFLFGSLKDMRLTFGQHSPTIR